MTEDLERIAENIAKFDEKTATAEDVEFYECMRRDLPRMLEVYNSLTVPELRLIWYLRQSPCKQIITALLRSARANYEAEQLAVKCRHEMRTIIEAAAHE